MSYVKNINQLQALVWGGKLQSISMPSPGSTFAVVKFLTPDACEKYLEATANGIKLPGTEKLVLVEKASGPDSLTDVFRNCIKGDITRCVRANDADEDWSDMMLMKIARGYGKMKREVDRIKRGKTVQGVSLHHMYKLQYKLTFDAALLHRVSLLQEFGSYELQTPTPGRGGLGPLHN